MISTTESKTYLSTLIPSFVNQSDFNTLLTTCIAEKPIPDILAQTRQILKKEKKECLTKKKAELEQDAFLRQIQSDEIESREDSIQHTKDEKKEKEIHIFFDEAPLKTKVLAAKLATYYPKLTELEGEANNLRNQIEMKKIPPPPNPSPVKIEPSSVIHRHPDPNVHSHPEQVIVHTHLEAYRDTSPKNTASNLLRKKEIKELEEKLDKIIREIKSINKEKERCENDIEGIKYKIKANENELAEISIRRKNRMEKEENRAYRKSIRDKNPKDSEQLSYHVKKQYEDNIQVYRSMLRAKKRTILNAVDTQFYRSFMHYLTDNISKLTLLDSQKIIISEALKLLKQADTMKAELADKKYHLLNLSKTQEHKTGCIANFKKDYANNQEREKILRQNNIQLSNDCVLLSEKRDLLTAECTKWNIKSETFGILLLICIVVGTTVAVSLEGALMVLILALPILTGIVSLISTLYCSSKGSEFAAQKSETINLIENKKTTLRNNEYELDKIPAANKYIQTTIPTLEKDISALQIKDEECNSNKEKLEQEYKVVLLDLYKLADNNISGKRPPGFFSPPSCTSTPEPKAVSTAATLIK